MKYILFILLIGLLLAFPFALDLYQPYVILSRTMLDGKEFKLERRPLFWENPSYSIFKMSEKNFEKYATILEKNGFTPFIKMSTSCMYVLPDEITFIFDNSDVVISEFISSDKDYTVIYDKDKELLYVSYFDH